MKTIGIEKLINGVATFNADPYCIENEELAQEVLDQIKNYGCHLIEDEDELEEAKRKLWIVNYNWDVYKAGECLFAVPGPEIKTLDYLADVINSVEDYPATFVAKVCEENGWAELDGEDIATDGHKVLMFNKQGRAEVFPWVRELNISTCPSDHNVIAVDDGELCAQFSLFENQEKILSQKQIESRCLSAVVANGFDEADLWNSMNASGVDCTVEIYKL